MIAVEYRRQNSLLHILLGQGWIKYLDFVLEALEKLRKVSKIQNEGSQPLGIWSSWWLHITTHYSRLSPLLFYFLFLPMYFYFLKSLSHFYSSSVSPPTRGDDSNYAGDPPSSSSCLNDLLLLTYFLPLLSIGRDLYYLKTAQWNENFYCLHFVFLIYFTMFQNNNLNSSSPDPHLRLWSWW